MKKLYLQLVIVLIAAITTIDLNAQTSSACSDCFIKNRWVQSIVASSSLGLTYNPDNLTSTIPASKSWEIEAIPGQSATTFYLKNVDGYLSRNGNTIQMGPLPTQVANAYWEIDAFSNEHSLILNPADETKGLHVENRTAFVEYGSIQTYWHSAHWEIASSATLPAGLPPVLKITSPTQGTAFYDLSPITLEFDAYDADASIQQLNVTIDGQSTTLTGSAPYTYTWTPTAMGTFDVEVEAIDTDGLSSTLEKTQLIVKEQEDLVKFIWPLAVSGTSENFGEWNYGGFFDLQPGAGKLDYNGGDQVNNGHRGLDANPWPFGWTSYREGRIDVIASADGIITRKFDNNQDDNCTASGNWNAVYVEHKDGSEAWYGHLKIGSLTTKAIGDSVFAGEYLGKVASSGNSSGPHIHFEILDSNRISFDPWFGPENQSIRESRWVAQKPYHEYRINKILLAYDTPYETHCDKVEYKHEKSTFFREDVMYITKYYTWTKEGQQSNMEVIDPTGTVVREWSFNHFDKGNLPVTEVYQVPSDAQAGTWKVKESFDGEVYEKTFTVVAANNAEPTISFTSPINHDTINGLETTVQISATDVDGTIDHVVYEYTVDNDKKRLIVNTSPFDFTYTASDFGTYEVTAMAVDNDGGVSTVESVSFTFVQSTVVCDAPAWDAATAYTVPTEVLYNGILYENQWYSQGEIPGTGQVWVILDFCDAAPLDCSTIPDWNASQVYSSPGSLVKYNGFQYSNQWWTSGDVPDNSQVWELQGPCDISTLKQAAHDHDHDHEGAISLYPNPAQNQVNVVVDYEWQGKTSVEFFNIHGVSVLVSTASSIDISSLPKGVYQVKVTTPISFETQQLIIQ